MRQTSKSLSVSTVELQSWQLLPNLIRNAAGNASGGRRTFPEVPYCAYSSSVMNKSSVFGGDICCLIICLLPPPYLPSNNLFQRPYVKWGRGGGLITHKTVVASTCLQLLYYATDNTVIICYASNCNLHLPWSSIN